MAKEVIQGYKQFEKRLDALGDPRKARKAIRAGLNGALNIVVKDVRQNVKRGTDSHTTYKGRLVAPGFASRSVKKVIKIVGDSLVGRVGFKKEAFYILFFETGTRFVRKDPTLEPAMTSNEKKMIEKYGEAMLKWIRKQAKKR